ncbi:MAG: hypothetical protein JXR66_10170 [Bacteroidales bacterium]|nr:hypothetical protein [Bacteroidales bacterium]
MKRKILIIMALLIGALTGCSKFDSGTSLRNSIETAAAKINDAAYDISASGGYELLTVTVEPGKNDEGFRDSIDLDMIAGVYDFSPYREMYHWCPFPVRFFHKTGESDSLIVNMPESMALHPRNLYEYIFKESTPDNNFTIAASDYHYYYSLFNKYDYRLLADFTLDDESIGSLDMMSMAEGYETRNYNSEFEFAEGYSIGVAKERYNDTISLSFALLEEDEILLMEKKVFSGSRMNDDFERTYILTIGNVDIVRSSEFDSIQVWLDGVLQANAAARIIDDSDTTGTICRKRDILLTFDDGTTANLSEMIKPGMEVLSTLVDSLHDMTFAKRVVDYIALNIYYHEFKYPRDK